jgi:hypothetical protein
MADNNIKYSSRTFSEIKFDLINYIKSAYPSVLQDFSDSSVGSILLDINSSVANNLSINTDKIFLETQLENSTQRNSLLNIAKNMGLNLPAKRPSVTICDILVTVPVKGNQPDSTYYPILEAGAQIIGGSKIFETQNNIDWNSSVSDLGDPNRSIIPNLDSNGVIVSYNVTKREVVINGTSNIYKRIITDADIFPFFTVTLPDSDVIEIESVILLEGTNFSTNPSLSDFNNNDYKYFEVDYLAQQRVFVEDTENSSSITNTNNIKAARWIDVTRKFIKEFTSNGYCVLTFGSGDAETNAFKEGFLKEGVSNRAFLDNFLNNTALGEKLKPNYTLFIRYRTGGGSNSNVGANILTSFGNYNLRVNGSRSDYNQNVQRSIKATNPIPAIGGNDGLTIDQIRNLIKYNFSSQNRDVTLTDYLLQLYKMPGKFGSPFRANAFKQNNKIVLSILGRGSDGKLSNTSNTLLKENIAEYLTQYRMVNDYIEIKDGKIYNLAFDVDVYVDNILNNQIAANIIATVRDYLDINKYEMNQDIFISLLQKEISKVNGVINVISIKVYNKVGGLYSTNVISQEILDTVTGEIKIINNTIYSDEESLFEIKVPEKDIRVYLRKSTT